MNATMMRTLETCCALAVSLAMLRTANADEPSKRACLAAYEGGQRARLDRDLLGARRELTRCAMPDCPGLVQSDCSEWLREVERQIPTLILSARWSDGTDITRARVWLDGRRVSERLDGKSVSVNPGQHTIRIEVDGSASEQVVVANQSERDRVLRFVIERPKPSPDPSPTPEAAGDGPGLLPYVLGGVALVSLAGFAYFGIKGTRDLRDLRDSCAPECSEASLDGVKRDLLIADILLGVAVLSAGAAAYSVVASAATNEGTPPTAYVSVQGRF